MPFNGIQYVGVNDHKIDLFEGQYRVPNGMSYNSYLIMGEKIAVMDSVEIRFTQEWLENISAILGERTPDYLVVQHMEPDHSGSIHAFISKFPQAKIVASSRAFAMMKQFFGSDFSQHQIVVGEGDSLDLGGRRLTFLTAPMIHWPEVIMTYDEEENVLFSADAFGKFGALDVEEDWTDEARRYYIGIVGKYGQPVQSLLKKAAGLKIEAICPLHGPVLESDIGYYINKYDVWSSYRPEEDGILVAYTSMYGNTRKAVELLVQQLREKSDKPVVVYDLARCDMSAAVSDAFRYSALVLATTTYNGGIFPFMKEFIQHLTARGFRGRTVALIENGSWAPAAARVMREMLSESKDIRFTANAVRILSSLNEESVDKIGLLAGELCGEEGVQPEEQAATGYICTICGYVYEGEELPEDFICPVCRKPASFFKKI